MKYILLLILILVPLYSYAGCDELKAAILNIEKAIEQQSLEIANTANDNSVSAQGKRVRVKQEIDSLIQLRKTLFEQQCSQAGKDIPVTSAKPAAPAGSATKPKAESEKKFKPAGKMY